MLFHCKPSIIEENLGGDLLNYHIKIEAYEIFLAREKCLGIWNDELYPIEGLDFDLVSTWMAYMPTDAFDIEYYEDDCEICRQSLEAKKDWSLI